MLKLNAYIYDYRGNRLKRSEISRARILVVKNKGLEIDEVFDIPKHLSKQEKIEFIAYVKDEISYQVFKEESSYLFYLKDKWDYETFDKDHNIIRKVLDKKSRYFTLYLNGEYIVSDEFPTRASVETKKEYIKQLADAIEVELRRVENKKILEEYGVELEEVSKNISTTAFTRPKTYLSRKIVSIVDGEEVPAEVTSRKIQETFKNAVNYEEEKEFLAGRLKDFVKNNSQVLREKYDSSVKLWQVSIKLVPLDESGFKIRNKAQIISTKQSGILREVDADIMGKLKKDVANARENYSETFGDYGIGIEWFEISLIS